MSGALEPRPARCFADAAEERTLSEDELANGVSLLRERGLEDGCVAIDGPS